MTMIKIIEYQLYRETRLGLGWENTTKEPYVRLKIPIHEYKELMNKTQADCLRSNVELEIERTVKDFAKSKGLDCEMIGYVEREEFSKRSRETPHMDLETIGYEITATLKIK